MRQRLDELEEMQADFEAYQIIKQFDKINRDLQEVYGEATAIGITNAMK